MSNKNSNLTLQGEISDWMDHLIQPSYWVLLTGFPKNKWVVFFVFVFRNIKKNKATPELMNAKGYASMYLR